MTTKDINKRLYIATIGENFAELALQYGLGLELDHFCMAEALDGQARQKTLQEADIDIQKAGISKKLYQKCGCSGIDMRTIDSERLILHAPFNELFPAAIDPKALELAYNRYRQTYQVARNYGINRMLVHSGYIPFVYFKSYHEDRSVEFWNKFMSDKPKEFSLLIENVLEDEPYMMLEMMRRLEADDQEHCNTKKKVCTAAETEEIKRKTGKSTEKKEKTTLKEGQNGDDVKAKGRFGICLDIGHAACRSQVPVEEWIKILGPYIRHAHLHNNDGTRDAHGAFDMADGKLDMDKIMEAFFTYGNPNMTYTIECIEPKTSIEWLAERGYI